MSKIVFYFSGTGNSFAVAELIAQKIGKAKLAPILNITDYDLDQYQVVGFVFPVYYYHTPEIVQRVLKGFKSKMDQQVFLIATYGSSCGYAMADVRAVLKNGAGFVQEFGITMPGNYILEYGAFPDWLQRSILKKSEKAAEEISKKILNRSSVHDVNPNWFAKIFKSTGDKKVKTFKVVGSLFSASEACIKCGRCAEICLGSNIKMHESGPSWGENCQQCMACVQWCPQNAIRHPKLKTGRKRYVHPKVPFRKLWGAGTISE